MNHKPGGCSRKGLWLPSMAVVAAVGCREPPEMWVDFRDETDPLPATELRASTEVEFQAFGRLPEDDDSDLIVRLVVMNLTADTLRYETGPCFFIVRAYASEEPAGRPLWDHRGRLAPSVYRMCPLILLKGGADPHAADTLELIPGIIQGYDRDLPADAGSFWVILNLEGSAHWVPLVLDDL